MRIVLSLFVVLVAILAVACSTKNTEVSLSHISLNEWEISGGHGQELYLPSGNVRIELHNAGDTVHQLAIWRGGEVHGDSVDGGMLVETSIIIAPGEVALLEVNFEEGERYILTCPIVGHTALGMHVEAVSGDEGHNDDDNGNAHEDRDHD